MTLLCTTWDFLPYRELPVRLKDLNSMKLIPFLFLCFLTSVAFSQRGKVTIDSTWYIGTWELKKIADEHLSYTKRKFKPETIRFTGDSVYVKVDSGIFLGTWKLLGGQANINIPSTKQFNYYWISRDTNDIFFQTRGMKYWKYFVRIPRAAHSILKRQSP
jgi:hypothetical protein